MKISYDRAVDVLSIIFRETTARTKLPKHILARNVYGFSDAQMRKIAHSLHAKAKEEIASGRARKFHGSIEEAL